MSNAELRKPLILVVDDEPSILESVAEVVTTANYDCRCCNTAEAALAAAEDTPPDLIVCDINLDGHSGLELCEMIKQQLGFEEVPVMFLSGAQIPDIIRRSHAAGGTYYLRKPFDPQVMLELIDKALWMPHLVAAHAGA